MYEEDEKYVFFILVYFFNILKYIFKYFKKYINLCFENLKNGHLEDTGHHLRLVHRLKMSAVIPPLPNTSS
jgi:hypothetical protein